MAVATDRAVSCVVNGLAAIVIGLVGAKCAPVKLAIAKAQPGGGDIRPATSLIGVNRASAQRDPKILRSFRPRPAADPGGGYVGGRDLRRD
jgi:hypothetical protein